ncbi:MAG: hypothetical protein A2085_08010 [Gemmatimonadetes bacterium GWC2_71_10]|nr:MAG: hypothetical protein A2085_08010 [Gemmatimonadetes bacterium GWC2_71_10]
MTDEWSDLLAALSEADARFLVVGAHAMAAHGVPRGTQDLDLWIEPTLDNAARVWRALAAFGAPLETLQLTREDFTRPDTVVQLGMPPLRIDLLTSLSGLPSFANAWNGRLTATLMGRTIPILGRAELIANKRAAGRLKDQADLEALGA